MSTFKIYLTVWLAIVIVEVRAISSDEEEDHRIEDGARTPPELLLVPHNQAGEMPINIVHLRMHKYVRFLVYLADSETGNLFCGGSILSNRHILTAASCFLKKTMREVYVIVSQMRSLPKDAMYTIVKIEVPEQYRPTEEGQIAMHDIAILTLNEEIKGEDWRIIRIGEEGDILNAKRSFPSSPFLVAITDLEYVISSTYPCVLSATAACTRSYPPFSTELLCAETSYDVNMFHGSPYIAVNNEEPLVIGISLNSKALQRNRFLLFTNAVIHKYFIQEILFKYFNEKH